MGVGSTPTVKDMALSSTLTYFIDHLMKVRCGLKQHLKMRSARITDNLTSPTTNSTCHVRLLLVWEGAGGGKSG